MNLMRIIKGLFPVKNAEPLYLREYEVVRGFYTGVSGHASELRAGRVRIVSADGDAYWIHINHLKLKEL